MKDSKNSAPPARHFTIHKDAISLDYPYRFEILHKNPQCIQIRDKHWLYPPFPVFSSTNYTLLEGQERFLFLVQAGVEFLSVFSSDALSEAEQLVQAAFYRHLFEALTALEKSRLIVHLQDHFMTEPQRLLEILPAIGEQASCYILQSLYQLKYLHEECQQYFSKEKQLKVPLMMSRYDKAEQREVLRCIKTYALNSNHTRIFLETLTKIHKKHKTPIPKILTLLAPIDTKTPRDPQAKRLFAALSALENPLTHTHLEKLSQQIRTFKLKPSWRIKTPKHLEGEGLHLHLHLRNYPEYQEAMQKFQFLDSEGLIEGLFHFL